MVSRIELIIRQFWKQILAAGLAIVFIIVNASLLGGYSFLSNLNNIVVLPLAVGISLLSLRLWRGSDQNSQNKRLWKGLVAGWWLWTIAEFWWAIAAWVTEEIPYPSLADLFWLAGYIPMYHALARRIRSMPKKMSAGKLAIILSVSAAVVALTVVFIVLPIAASNTPGDTLANGINIIYPLADLVLLIFGLQLLFAYTQGLYGRSWQWLTAGFALFACADLIFSFAATAGFYYPDEQANLLSTLGVDVPYAFAYLAWYIGLTVFRKVTQSQAPVAEQSVKLRQVPTTHILIFSKGVDNVTSVSNNFSEEFAVSPAQGKPLPEVLGIARSDADFILAELLANGVLHERGFQAVTRFSKEIVFISGIIGLNSQSSKPDIILLVRVRSADFSLDKHLNDYEGEVLALVLNQTGTAVRELDEQKQLLVDYYRAFITPLYNYALMLGGSIMADAYIGELQLDVKKLGLSARITSNRLIEIDGQTVEDLQAILPVLYKTARRMAADTCGEDTVNMIIQNVRASFGKRDVRNLMHFGLIQAEITA